MDFATLKKRVEAGAVVDVNALVADLNLIFDNAMTYNGKGSDYYEMANQLKEVVRAQHAHYALWRAEHGSAEPGPTAEEEAEAADEKAAADAGRGQRKSRRRS
jgi:hypothetical protein